ncbi:MAG: hypothetical protein M5U28_01080 [Sandaracinaceae bacterium]|nr:hypothetical protein [Sandaracinaceae bacterium]
MRRALLALLAAACTEPASCPPADLAPLDGAPAWAFVASDYASSAVGLLEADGSMLREAWLDTGTAAPGLVATLSGDVVLASSPPAPCVLTVIDRSGTDVVTLIDACASEPSITQIDVGPTFEANPQDVLVVDGARALVSRHEPSLHPSAAELERGNDLLAVDWRDGRVLSRVDLSALDAVDGERAYARPARMVRLRRGARDAIVVGLARLSEDFMRAGPGAVAVLDTATMRASEVALEGLVNCGEVDAAPGEPAVAIVTCQGASFGDAEERRAGAGVAALELGEDGGVVVRSAWRAADHPESPVFNTWSVPLSGERVVTVAMGDLRQGVGDALGLVDLSSGEATLLFEAGTAFVLGDGAYDAGARLLLLPDAHEGTIRRFEMSEPPRELSPVEASSCRGLPPREVRRIRD